MITEMHADQSWKTPREAPWPVTPNTSNCEQRYGMIGYDLLPGFPSPMMTSLKGKEAESY